ncbi:MAG TPA: hypothetical protein VN821_04575 [Candidatus Udaeobacter sp.]|nr:hypothetical protein [Candidatus Udaeobacter sp.]
MADTEAILMVDASASRIRFQAFAVRLDDEIAPLYEGRIAPIGGCARFLVRNPFGSRLLDKVYAPGEIADPGTAARQLSAWTHSMHLHDRLLAIGHCIRAEKAAAPIMRADRALDGARPIPAASLAVIECFGSCPATKAQFAVFGRDVVRDGAPAMREAGARVLRFLKQRAHANAAGFAGARVRYRARGA